MKTWRTLSKKKCFVSGSYEVMKDEDGSLTLGHGEFQGAGDLDSEAAWWPRKADEWPAELAIITTNHPKSQWLKIMTAISHKFMGQQDGSAHPDQCHLVVWSAHVGTINWEVGGEFEEPDTLAQPQQGQWLISVLQGLSASHRTVSPCLQNGGRLPRKRAGREKASWNLGWKWANHHFSHNREGKSKSKSILEPESVEMTKSETKGHGYKASVHWIPQSN